MGTSPWNYFDELGMDKNTLRIFKKLSLVDIDILIA